MPKHHDHQLPELEPWKYPRDYIGEDYTGYLVVGIGRNRDSGPLENSNYETALAELNKAALPLERDWPHAEVGGPPVLEVSAKHWAVGWIEYLLVHPDAKAVVRRARELRAQLEDYPVLDENDFSDREYEEYQENWESWGRAEFEEEIIRRAADLDDSWFEITPGKIKFTRDELLDALPDVSNEAWETVIAKARENLPWEYEINGNECRINIRDMVKSVDDSEIGDLIEAAYDVLYATLRRSEIKRYARAGGFSDEQAEIASREGLERYSQMRKKFRPNPCRMNIEPS